VAGQAITDLMGTGEREPAQPVDLTDILNNPGFRGMASETILAQGSFVKVLVAIEAFPFGGRKIQGFMAPAAVNSLMLADELIAGAVMIKRHALRVDFPPGSGGVTESAIDFEALPVWRLPVQDCYPEQKT
jgi:hypothetical protein